VLSSGSFVRRGVGNGVVILTGAKTCFGRTTELVQQARPKLHIEAVVARIVRWLFVTVGALLGVVIALSLIRGTPLQEMIPLMLVLLMSAVPVALPVMFTVSMAVGSKELARRGVLVTRLSAAEDAATMDVLCVDKTGTITMNTLTVTGVTPLVRRLEPMCCPPAPSRRRNRTRIRSTSRSSPQHGRITYSTASPPARRSPSLHSTRSAGGRKLLSSRPGNGCA
jgi:H+-transporting ATPase